MIAINQCFFFLFCAADLPEPGRGIYEPEPGRGKCRKFRQK
nr:MAG TPA: Ig gamma-1 chain C region-like beta-sandwich, binding protein, IMMUNE [Caudoviricetes sp.]